MPHKAMTDPEWRDFVVGKFEQGDKRFEQLELGQAEMLRQITDSGESRHRENIARMGRLETMIFAHTKALESLSTAMTANTAVCESIAGIVKVGRGTKTFACWLWTNVPAVASAVSSLIMLALIALWLLGRGPMPLFSAH